MENVFQSKRFKWMVEIIQDNFNISIKNINVEDILKSDRYIEIVKDFLEGKGSKKIFIFYQSLTDNQNSLEEYQDIIQEQQLFLTDGENERLIGKCIYFLRTAPEGKSVNLNELDLDFTFGQLSNQLLENVCMIINNVFTPLINEKLPSSIWENCEKEVVDDFFNNLNQFSESLEDSLVNFQQSLKQCKIDHQRLNQLISESEKTSYLQTLFEEWITFFEEKFKKDDLEIKKNLNEGPKTELEYWKKQQQESNLLTELIKSRDFQQVKTHLINISTKRIDEKINTLIQRFKSIDNSLIDRLNEARDNVKYLSTLEKFIDPLYNGTPQTIIEILPPLLNAIKMIHTIARYYNTSNKMTNLFVKITNQMIKNCKKQIITNQQNQNEIWNIDPEILIQKLNNCIILCQKYKNQYEITKKTTMELPKSRHWDFDENIIFGKFDNFIKRVKKLIEIFSTILQFQGLQKHSNLEGMSQLIQSFDKKIENFKKKNHVLLEEDKNRFDKDYVDLIQDIHKLDSSLQSFIDHNFSKFKNISYSLKLLKKFESIMKRDNIKNRLNSKYDSILQNYGSEIDGIQKIYEDQKNNPPVIRNMPIDAGRIIWVRHLFQKLSGPILKFPTNIINIKDMKKYIDKYNIIGRSLIVYELFYTQCWCNDIERIKVCLQTTLFVIKEENDQKKIQVNFEKDIQKLLREAKVLERAGVQNITESAKIIQLQEEKFKKQYYEVEYIKNEYERIVFNIKPILKTLLEPVIEDFEYKLRPGIITLTWTSMNIDSFITQIKSELNKMNQLIICFNDIIDNRIENNLKTIQNIELVKLQNVSKSMSLESFVEQQQQHIKKQVNVLIAKNIEIERAVDDLLEIAISYPLDPIIEPMNKSSIQIIKQYYFWFTYKTLLQSTQNSLNLMKVRICENKNNDSKPFFEVYVKLQNGEIILEPSLDEIQKAINKAATAVLNSSKQLLGWDQISSEHGEDKESYFKIITQDKEIVKVILLLTGSIQGTKNRVNTFLHKFDCYKWLWEQNIIENLKAFQKKNPQLEDYEKKLQYFNEIQNGLEKIQKFYEIGALSLNTEFLIQGLKSICQDWKQSFSEDLHKKAKNLLQNLTETIKNYNQKLQKEVKDIDSLGVIMQTIVEIRQEQSLIELKFQPVVQMYELLDNYLQGGITDKEEMDNRQLLKKNWNDIIDLSELKLKELQKDQDKYLNTLKKSVKQLIKDVNEFRRNFEEEGPMVRGITPKEASDRLKRFENEYELKEATYMTNKRGEDIFGLQNQKYDKLEQTYIEIKNLNKLYALYNQLNQTTQYWEEQIWYEIGPTNIKDWEEQIQKFSENCLKLPKNLKEWPAYKDLKEKIDNYKEILPYVKDLKENYIKPRHWQKISEFAFQLNKNFNINIFSTENFYFKDLINAKLLKFQEDLDDIIDSAKKQEKIDSQRQEIDQKWNELKFDFKDWGKRKIPILSGGKVEEIQDILEEDIQTLTGLSAMRHVGPFKQEVTKLQEDLQDVQMVLQLIVKVQISWTSLESVFTSGDIAKHMSSEAKRFQKIDKIYIKTVMEKIFDQKKVKLCCKNDIIKSVLPSLLEELEACQKQLEKYLEQKRKEFPRFYFVSNPVLLKFLSQGSDPENIQDEFDKLFDSISKVTFERVDKKSNDKAIKEIKNSMGNDDEVIILNNLVLCKGNIEQWLTSLQNEMYSTIMEVCKQVSNAILTNWKDSNQVIKFIDEFCAQGALLGLQMKFTKLVQDVLERKASERSKLMNEVRNEVGQLIMMTLVDFCRTEIETLMKRQKIETLVTMQVYLKEVVTAWKFRDANDFDWLKYTRIYWKEENNGQCIISITDWEAVYTCEYLGVKERLCITPLTDRCYITLAQAMSMHYGGAPAGPAGTGKTETVKDLGRTLGIFVVVTNCSGEHRYTDMAKIFKGLCQSGLWGCFDEFNRIDLEVLSVVAMQVESITSAKKNNLKEFYFPDEVNKIPLINTCGYFITMNPGYAGRQELPENLKVLFRGVTMMVPDREVIIRVKLASCGYQEYNELAKKFKILYGLCEEQLSKQRHYDFGLRNILSVLRTAGNVLRNEKTSNPNEQSLLMKTLQDMNVSKLVAEDVPLFNALLNDIFILQKENKKKQHQEIENKIIEKADLNYFVPIQTWVLKCVQLYETSLVRHGFMIVGQSGTGKSSIIQTLTETLSEVKVKHVCLKLNPKSFTSQEMYGVKNFAGEWTPGIFSEMWRKVNEKKPNRPVSWIICDGPVDAIWIENLNTVLDDNKVLTLANGDRIFMLDTCKMVFEVENLNNASPATVSRCGIIFVSKTDLDYSSVINGWIDQRSKDINKTSQSESLTFKHQVKKIFSKEDSIIVRKILLKYFNDYDVIKISNDASQKNQTMELDNILKVFQTLNFLSGMLNSIFLKKVDRQISELEYEKLILFCVLWGVTGIYELRERILFIEQLKKNNIPLPKYQEDETPYEYIIQFDKTMEWKQLSPNEWKPPKQIVFSQLLLPTIDSQKAEFIFDLILNQSKTSIQTKSVLVIGSSGTAKTSSILMYCNKFNSAEMLMHRINFSSATQPVNFQASIESVCETKIRKGFGPKDGKMMTVFIDDFSMPERNTWGDQITLEIVRQLMEDFGFYRLEKNERGNYKFIENLQYLAAMNHPGGGRNDIPNRLKRQFFIFNITPPS